jgi:hypothetical protein
LLPTQPLAIDAQGITSEPQQAGNRRATDFELPAQLARQLANRLARPFESCNGITGGCIGQQVV